MDTGEDFRVTLTRESSDGETDSASCEIGWNEAEKGYKTSCDVPYNLGVAGDWDFQIELKPRTGSSGYRDMTRKKLEVHCPAGEYMYECGDLPNASSCALENLYHCMPCDLQRVVCEADAEKLSQIELQAGYWRSGPISEKFESCLYPSACAGGNESSSYCNDGYAGPLCATCDRDYTFVDDSCSPCEQTARNTMVMSIWASAFGGVLVLIGVLFAVYRAIRKGSLGSERLRRRLDAAVRGFHERRHSFSVPTKAYIVLIAFQTLYQFSAITTMKSDSDLQYPQ